MQATIFLVLWTTSYDGNVDTGVVPCKTNYDAEKKMRELYCQSLQQIYVNNNYGRNVYHSYDNYYVESENGECWERAEILSVNIEMGTVVKDINI